jgi:hypothetical protein
MTNKSTWASFGPSGESVLSSWRARETCTSLLPAVVRHYMRPMGHVTHDVLLSWQCLFVLVHVWKNAGSAMEQFLRGELKNRSSAGCKIDSIHDWSPHRVLGQVGVTHRARSAMSSLVRHQRMRWVAFTRDPTERFMSGFHEIFGRHKEVLLHANQNLDMEQWVRQLTRFVESEYDRTPNISRHGCGTESWRVNFHVAPQVSFLSDWDGKPLPVTYLGVLIASKKSWPLYWQTPHFHQSSFCITS